MTQVSLNVSLVAFWALLMDHGVWFFDSWTAEDCLWTKEQTRDSTTKTLDSTTKGTDLITKKMDSNRFSFLVVESDLDCKLRIIMRIEWSSCDYHNIFVNTALSAEECSSLWRFYQVSSTTRLLWWRWVRKWDVLSGRGFNKKNLKQNHSEMKCNST